MSSSSSPATGKPLPLQRPGVIGSLIALVTFAVHSRALTHEFLLYDDNFFIWNNTMTRSGLTWETVRWSFTETWGFWFPLTRLSHLLDVELFGMEARGHHLTSVLIHSASAGMLFAAVNRLLRATWPSVVVALLFALHPLNVQTVAWLSERKEVLCGLFSIATLWAYAAYAQRGGLGRMLGVTGLFVCALMAKPMAVTLPAVLLLLDAWPLDRLLSSGRIQWRCVLEKLHLFAITALFSVLAHYAQDSIKATADMGTFPLSMRLSNALVSYVAYLRKLLAPTDLAPFYPHPYGSIPGWEIAMAVAVLGTLSALFLLLRREHPHLLVGWLWWLGMFVPVIGLVQIGRQGMADHYAYQPSIGLMLAGVSALWRAAQAHAARRLFALGATLVVAVLGVLSVWQHAPWRDTETLFLYAREVTGENWLAEQTLARLRELSGDLPAAEQHLLTALEQLDQDPQVRSSVRLSLAAVLLRQKRNEEALAQMEQAVRETPQSPMLNKTMGEVLGKMGRLAPAIERYEAAVALAPEDVESRYGLGVVLLRAGRAADAVPHLRTAARLSPRLAGIRQHLGQAYLELGQPAQAVEELRAGLELMPDSPALRAALKRAESLLRQGPASEGSSASSASP